MQLTPEQKTALEVPVKETLKALVNLLEVTTLMAVEATATKLDDAVIPLIEPIAKAKLLEVIDGLKL
jgi:hypothetical protein